MAREMCIDSSVRGLSMAMVLSVAILSVYGGLLFGWRHALFEIELSAWQSVVLAIVLYFAVSFIVCGGVVLVDFVLEKRR